MRLLRPVVVIPVLAAFAGGVGPTALAADPIPVQQIAADTLTDPAAQHATQAEPDSFAAGDTVVTAFQVGRFFDGGADAIGFSTSHDGGRTWTSGLLPFLTANTPGAAGTFARASDPAVAYDAAHGVWLVVSLALGVSIPPPPSNGPAFFTSIVVSRSVDGIVWTAPQVVAPLTAGAYDKEWITCDNRDDSAFRGRCYVSYTDFSDGYRIAVHASLDGGVTWGPAVKAASPVAEGSGSQPTIAAGGVVVVPFASFEASPRLLAIRSTDGGATFSGPAVIAPVSTHEFSPVRAEIFPSAEVDGAGTVYVAWPDCGFRAGCPEAPTDIVLSTSADGITWTTPRLVPTDDPAASLDHFTPGLAVDPATSGATARLAVAYYTRPIPCAAGCALGAAFVGSADGGQTWSPPRSLATQPMALEWIADTATGRLLGDYISTSFLTGGYAVPVLALAGTRDASFHQAIAAARIAPTELGPPPPTVTIPTTTTPTVTTPTEPTPTEPTPTQPGPTVTTTTTTTETIPVEPPALSVRLSRRSVVFGGSVTLSGAVSSGAGGEVVAISGLGSALTQPDGAWRVSVRPPRSTTYRVTWSTADPAQVAVSVSPRVALSAPRRVLTLRVVAASSFAGRRVALQRWDGRRWAFVSWLRLGAGSRLAARLPRSVPSRSLVRVVVPRAPATPPASARSAFRSAARYASRIRGSIQA